MTTEPEAPLTQWSYGHTNNRRSRTGRSPAKAATTVQYPPYSTTSGQHLQTNGNQWWVSNRTEMPGAGIEPPVFSDVPIVSMTI